MDCEKLCDCENILECDCECHDIMPVDPEEGIAKLTSEELICCLQHGHDILEADQQKEIAELKLELCKYKIADIQRMVADLSKTAALRNSELKAFSKLRTSKVNQLMKKYKIKGSTFAYDPETGVITEGVK